MRYFTGLARRRACAQPSYISSSRPLAAYEACRRRQAHSEPDTTGAYADLQKLTDPVYWLRQLNAFHSAVPFCDARDDGSDEGSVVKPWLEAIVCKVRGDVRRDQKRSHPAHRDFISQIYPIEGWMWTIHAIWPLLTAEFQWPKNLSRLWNKCRVFLKNTYI